jgi:hypothetical protein
MPEVIVLDAEQVHAFREKLQILLCLPYDRPKSRSVSAPWSARCTT